jgi:branched-chain amino acid aminotransferase
VTLVDDIRYPHVFHDGGWTDRAHATVGVGSLALRYGLSVFEGIRLYRQADDTRPAGETQLAGDIGVRPFRLDAHLARLGNSLRLMRLPDPGIDKVAGLIDDLIRHNGIDDDSYVRVAVTPANPGQLDGRAEPVLTITATPMGRKRWLRDRIGMRLQVSAWQRADDLAFPSAAKNISNYAGPRLALLDAKAAGYDSCVLTNGAGRLCEAPTAALFLVSDGVLRTPALTEGVLPSITRQWVLHAAVWLGLTAAAGPVTRMDAYLADEAFLCGTGIEFAPVGGFDGHDCRGWPDTPVTDSLVAAYFAEARGGTR